MAITSVTVSPSGQSYKSNRQYNLSVSVVVTSGSTTGVTWTTNDANITVSNGLVTIPSGYTSNFSVTATSTVDGTKSGTSFFTLHQNSVINSIGIMFDAGNITPVLKQDSVINSIGIMTLQTSTNFNNTLVSFSGPNIKGPFKTTLYLGSLSPYVNTKKLSNLIFWGPSVVTGETSVMLYQIT